VRPGTHAPSAQRGASEADVRYVGTNCPKRHGLARTESSASCLRISVAGVPPALTDRLARLLTTANTQLAFVKRLPHPKREVERALRYAEERRCAVDKAGRASHAWGRLYAPDGKSIMSVWSTPKSAENHARQIRRFADRFGEQP